MRPRPDHDVHAEGAAVACDRGADPAIAENAERLVAQRGADADLPVAGLERGHLLRDLPERGKDQAPGQLGGGIGGRAGMLARRHDDAVLRAGVDVDVRIDAALADELELGQAFEQRCADLRALADQDQHLGVLQAFGQRVEVLDMVVPDRDVVAVELPEAGQRPHGVVIVVENRDFHSTGPLATIAVAGPTIAQDRGSAATAERNRLRPRVSG